MADFYTLQELAEKLGVSVRTVMRMMKRGELQAEEFYRVGRSIRFPVKVMAVKFHLGEE